MAFKLDDMLIDRIIMATAETFEGDVLYTLTQLQNASINITAESNDVTDRDGTVIKRFWRGKTGEFTAENALINLNIIAAESGPVGEAKQLASASAPINNIPGLKVVKASDGTSVTLKNATGTPRVYGLFTNGTLGDEFQTGGSASASAASSIRGGRQGISIILIDVSQVFPLGRTISSALIRMLLTRIALSELKSLMEPRALST